MYYKKIFHYFIGRYLTLSVQYKILFRISQNSFKTMIDVYLVSKKTKNGYNIIDLIQKLV